MSETTKAIFTWFLSLFNFSVYIGDPSKTSTLDRIDELEMYILEAESHMLNLLIINEYFRTFLMVLSVLVILALQGESILLIIKARWRLWTSKFLNTKLGKWYSKWRSSKLNKQKKAKE